MANIGFRPLAKLIILPLDAETGIPTGIPFVAMYNPTTFSFTKSQETTQKPLKNTDGSANEFNYNPNQTISLQLFFDGTSASPPMGIPVPSNEAASIAVASVGVEALITLFFQCVYDIRTKFHSPASVRLIWGAGLFARCKLQNATVNYTLINRLGLPLRATIDATFLTDVDDKVRASLIDKFTSPDVTKVHTVKAGDTIYNIAKNEYEDESYYLQIAQANDLKNYRRLKPGMQLILPPIKKDE